MEFFCRFLPAGGLRESKAQRTDFLGPWRMCRSEISPDGTRRNLSPTALPMSENKGCDWLTSGGRVHFSRGISDLAEELKNIFLENTKLTKLCCIFIKFVKDIFICSSSFICQNESIIHQCKDRESLRLSLFCRPSVTDPVDSMS